MSSSAEITQLLALVAAGDVTARDQLWSRIYPEVRKHAEVLLANWDRNEAMSATDLAHMVFLRIDQVGVYASAPNRRYFYGIVVQAMTRLLIDEYRSRNAEKRGGGRIRLSLDDVPEPEAAGSELDVLALKDALESLQETNPDHYDIFVLRGMLGRSSTEIAADLSIDETTVRRRWRAARAWVERAVSGRRESTPASDHGPLDKA